MNTNNDSSFFIPRPTNLYNMRFGELMKKDLGQMSQFQGKVMSGGGQNGFLPEDTVV